MPFKLGTPELIILLVILIVLFGVGRIGRLGTEIGQGIRNLRRGLTADDEENEAAGNKESS
jgi:sec-independent protein translocase protein TatA